MKFVYLTSSNKQCSLIPSDFAHSIEKCSFAMEGEGKGENSLSGGYETKHESLSFLQDVTLCFCAAVLFSATCVA